MNKRLPVHERFHTWQGEGLHLGRAAFFIRLYGCPLRCVFCDSAGTWSEDYRPEHIHMMTVEELGQESQDSGAEIVVLTGGEPGMFDLGPLTNELHSRGLKVHIETSGSFALRGDFDFITVSPKWATFDDSHQVNSLMRNLAFASEWKMIIENSQSIEDWWKAVGFMWEEGMTVWLHPEWSQRENPDVLRAISQSVKTSPKVFRAGWQLHKLYKSDQLDERSAPPVPLGGDINRGY